MPRVKKYPEWVHDLCPEGHSVKMKDGNYYLYKTTSIYRPGKSPLPKSEYVGRITESGIIPAKSKKVKVGSSPEVYEYGFSYFLEKYAYAEFRKHFDTDERAWGTFLLIISKHSRRSYLTYGKQLKDAEELHVCICSKEKLLESITGITITDLYCLKDIYIITDGRYRTISKVETEAAALLEKLGVDIHA